MLWYVLIGFLAAFGALCALWAVLGAWLTGPDVGCVILRPAPGGEAAAVRRYRWLRDLGLVKGPLTVVADEVGALSEQYPGVEFLTLEQYQTQLEQEREKLDGI